MTAVVRPNAPQFAHLLPWEDEADYAARLDELVVEYAPQGPVERALVERIALLLQRRERLALAERAVHMAALEDAVDSRPGYGGHGKRLARRTGVGVAHRCSLDRLIETHGDHVLTDALVKSEADDANDRHVLAEDREATAEALAILEAGGADAYERALAALSEATEEAWRDRLEIEEGCDPPEFHPTTESLREYIEREMAPWEEREADAIDARPALRLQAYGESLDPHRMERPVTDDLHAVTVA